MTLQSPDLEGARSAALRVVALSLVLIVVLEALHLMAAVARGSFQDPGPFLIDLVEKVPWALFVCTGVWLGLRVGHGRLLLAALAGLIAAPIGSLLLRAVAEGAHALALAGAPKGPSPLLVAGIKGVEYACLGFLVGWLGQRTWAAVHHHIAAGLAVGVLFGSLLLALTSSVSANPLDPPGVVTWAVNELLFPVGCALILFSATRAAPGGTAPHGSRRHRRP